ncbi:MAG: hypothetical protein GY894_06210 [Planctomycetes bacterium]|nr:hypothetical protein [Planctomycetota bacterium]
MPDSHVDHAGTTIETIQSLLVAFACAMIFRGFVVEGFVIPTGSMAPTLMGQHVLIESQQTGSVTPIGLDTMGRKPNASLLRDHLAGRQQPFEKTSIKASGSRMGDRILVAKWLYPFMEPDRWDAIVFRNPANPEGSSGTYIKRLIGLPGETIWIVDGDIFVRNLGEERFHVARKPRDVRGAVWQQVWDSNKLPTAPGRLKRAWKGWPWRGAPQSAWKPMGASLESTGEGTDSLVWDDVRFPLDDWNSYNMFTPVSGDIAVSDLRVSATVTPESSGVKVMFELKSRMHTFQYRLDDGVASIEMWPDSDPGKVQRVDVKIGAMHPGQAVRIVAEQIDQTARILVDGDEALELAYDWSPRERLEAASGLQNAASMSDGELARRMPARPAMRWQFSGGPVKVSNMQVDRDLYYRSAILTSMSRKHAPLPEFEEMVRPGSPAAGTHPDSLVTLGPDQFFVLGDNSGRSLDGRLWGAPDPIVAEQVDPMPFIVPRDLLIGKAFVVYFPAPLTSSTGIPIPDFGRLRFIH